jgi:HEPN domain-containing protein
MTSAWHEQVKEFQKMKLSEYAKSLSFEEFTQMIQDPKVLKNSKVLLRRITPRVLLSAYIISNYPDILYSSPRQIIEETLYEYARDVIYYLDHIPPSSGVSDFKELYNTYSNQFKVWKHRDHADLLQILAKTHKQVRNWKDVTYDDQATKQTLGTLEGLAHDLGGKEAVHHVKTSSEWGLVDPTSIGLKLTEKMHQVFWDRFTEELSRDPPEYVQYPDLVGEIRRRIEHILPRLENARSVEWIRQHLDENRIKSSIQIGEYGLQEIYNVCTFCLERVKELGAASDDSRIDAYLARLHLEMGGTLPPVHEIVPNVFKVCLESLDQISFIRDAILESIEKDKDTDL